MIICLCVPACRSLGAGRSARRQVGSSKRLGCFDGHDMSDCELKIVETEKVLGALLRSIRKP